MNDEEARRVHTNDCLRDDEAARLALLAEGEPVGSHDRRLREAVRRLLRGVAALEGALRTAWAEAASWKRECVAERELRRADALRRSEGKAGPEHEVELIARLLRAHAAAEPSRASGLYEEALLRRWAGGASVGDEVRSSVATWERAAEEHRAFLEREVAEQAVQTEELRRRLREAVDKLARGEVPEELRPAVRKARREAKAGKIAP